MSTVMKIDRKNKDTQKMINMFKEFDSYVASVGHFADQGNHPTAKDPDGAPISYVELMALHAGANPNMPRRDILAILKYVKNPQLKGSKYSKAFKHMMRGEASPQAAKEAVEKVAASLMEEEKKIFGNPKYLTVTSNPTPMVDTGATKKATTYRVKKKGG